jgi:hypothetical protein
MASAYAKKFIKQMKELGGYVEQQGDVFVHVQSDGREVRIQQGEFARLCRANVFSLYDGKWTYNNADNIVTPRKIRKNDDGPFSEVSEDEFARWLGSANQ